MKYLRLYDLPTYVLCFCHQNTVYNKIIDTTKRQLFGVVQQEHSIFRFDYNKVGCFRLPSYNNFTAAITSTPPPKLASNAGKILPLCDITHMYFLAKIPFWVSYRYCSNCQRTYYILIVYKFR